MLPFPEVAMQMYIHFINNEKVAITTYYVPLASIGRLIGDATLFPFVGIRGDLVFNACVPSRENIFHISPHHVHPWPPPE